MTAKPSGTITRAASRRMPWMRDGICMGGIMRATAVTLLVPVVMAGYDGRHRYSVYFVVSPMSNKGFETGVDI
jgi:hypothetical protein